MTNKSKVATVSAFKSIEYLLTLANAGEMTRRAAEWSLDTYFARIDRIAAEQFPETARGR